MIGLCLALGLSCATAETPPRVDPSLPGVSPPVVRPEIVKPPVSHAGVTPPDGFPLDCERVPPPELRRVFVNAARSNPSVSACALAKQSWCESGFRVRAVSPAGAKGLAQFLDGTARELGVSDSFDPDQAVPAMARYVVWTRGAWSTDGRMHDDIVGLGGCGFNHGRTACYRNQAKNGWYLLAEALPHLPGETRGYIPCILTGRRG